jgi:hypothetical protein
MKNSNKCSGSVNSSNPIYGNGFQRHFNYGFGSYLKVFEATESNVLSTKRGKYKY